MLIINKYYTKLTIYLHQKRCIVISLIVFSGNCKLKSEFPNNVIKLNNFNNYFLKQKNDILTESEIDEYYNKIINIKIKGLMPRLKHIFSIKVKTILS